jgi:hypothetical protein
MGAGVHRAGVGKLVTNWMELDGRRSAWEATIDGPRKCPYRATEQTARAGFRDSGFVPFASHESETAVRPRHPVYAWFVARCSSRQSGAVPSEAETGEQTGVRLGIRLSHDVYPNCMIALC